MSDLNTIDKQVLENLFEMGGGYVLDFSNRTMGEFFENELNLNIYDEKYQYDSCSKANMLRGFRKVEENKVVGNSILKLINYIEHKILIGSFKETDFSDKVIQKSKEIANSLITKNNKEYLEIDIENLSGREYVNEKLKDCERSMLEGDFDNAITKSYSLVHGVIEDIYSQITGSKIKPQNIRKDFWLLKKELFINEVVDANGKLKGILQGLEQLFTNYDDLSQTFGDRHTRPIKPKPYEAKLIVGSAKLFVQFLYDWLYEGKNSKAIESVVKNIRVWKQAYGLKGYGGVKLFTLYDLEKLESDGTFENIFNLSTGGKIILKNFLVNNYDVGSFNSNDKFFLLLVIIQSLLSIKDTTVIYDKNLFNSQAISLIEFMYDYSQEYPDKVESEIKAEINILRLLKIDISSLYHSVRMEKDRNKIKRCIKEKKIDKDLLKKMLFKYFSEDIKDKDFTEVYNLWNNILDMKEAN